MVISVTGYNQMMNSVNKYRNINTRLSNVAKELCAVGEPIIRHAHHGRKSKVWSEPFRGGYRIIADGEDVLFIEFGSGDSAGSTAVLYDQIPMVVRPGSWSKTHSKQYSTFGYWYFGGQKYYQTTPHPSFYHAYQAMVKALPQIVSQEFQ